MGTYNDGNFVREFGLEGFRVTDENHLVLNEELARGSS